MGWTTVKDANGDVIGRVNIHRPIKLHENANPTTKTKLNDEGYGGLSKYQKRAAHFASYTAARSEGNMQKYEDDCTQGQTLENARAARVQAEMEARITARITAQIQARATGGANGGVGGATAAGSLPTSIAAPGAHDSAPSLAISNGIDRNSNALAIAGTSASSVALSGLGRDDSTVSTVHTMQEFTNPSARSVSSGNGGAVAYQHFDPLEAQKQLAREKNSKKKELTQQAYDTLQNTLQNTLPQLNGSGLNSVDKDYEPVERYLAQLASQTVSKTMSTVMPPAPVGPVALPPSGNDNIGASITERPQNHQEDEGEDEDDDDDNGFCDFAEEENNGADVSSVCTDLTDGTAKGIVASKKTRTLLSPFRENVTGGEGHAKPPPKEVIARTPMTIRKSNTTTSNVSSIASDTDATSPLEGTNIFSTTFSDGSNNSADASPTPADVKSQGVVEPKGDDGKKKITATATSSVKTARLCDGSADSMTKVASATEVLLANRSTISTGGGSAAESALKIQEHRSDDSSSKNVVTASLGLPDGGKKKGATEHTKHTGLDGSSNQNSEKKGAVNKKAVNDAALVLAATKEPAVGAVDGVTSSGTTGSFNKDQSVSRILVNNSPKDGHPASTQAKNRSKSVAIKASNVASAASGGMTGSSNKKQSIIFASAKNSGETGRPASTQAKSRSDAAAAKASTVTGFASSGTTGSFNKKQSVAEGVHPASTQAKSRSDSSKSLASKASSSKTSTFAGLGNTGSAKNDHGRSAPPKTGKPLATALGPRFRKVVRSPPPRLALKTGARSRTSTKKQVRFEPDGNNDNNDTNNAYSTTRAPSNKENDKV